ncbi:MarR family winged helix-turn-helix transcriptional regulator [Actinacidiphila glaucinigra]|uniref:DNA-binding transcriptional regulator, MarR family n=1 Tax=Actinacidiphila glaucinigra TaxID=235986 RepID=A0A239CQR0_9ACTN|nr:MarR family transcriptional regulator [Actinacidiphila glaucinigra]SNS22249.1 DNA-binding transcriptional regulator, MarR family [Actinacidiphila glaucinigra]
MPATTGSQRDAAVAAASSVVEALEVLWGRGRDAGDPPVPPSQLRVLFALEGNEGINLRTLCDVLGAGPPAVSRLCDRLQAVGYLTRDTSPTSRREVCLWLTPRGTAFLAQLRERREEELATVVSAMPERARRALLEGLTAFRSAAEATGLGAVRPLPGGRSHTA